MSAALPRVTQILQAVGLTPDFSLVPPAVLEAARARGSAVHTALEAHAYGYLTDADITPEIAPYFSAYLKFLADSGHEPIASEIEVVHPGWQYVGHPDRVGYLNGRRVIIDFKTGDAGAGQYQVAGYTEAWNALNPTAPVVGGIVLGLKDDGTYRLAEVDLPAATRVFLAAVVVYQARQQEGRL